MVTTSLHRPGQVPAGQSQHSNSDSKEERTWFDTIIKQATFSFKYKSHDESNSDNNAN